MFMKDGDIKWKGNTIWNKDKIESLYLNCKCIVTIPQPITQEHLPHVCYQGVVLVGMHQGVVQVDVVHHMLEMSLSVVLLVEGKVHEVVLCVAHQEENNLQVKDLPEEGDKLLQLVQDKTLQQEYMVAEEQLKKHLRSRRDWRVISTLL